MSARRPPVKLFCLDAEAIGDVDYSAAETIRETVTALQAKGVAPAIARPTDDVRAEFDRYGLTELIGADAFHSTIGLALTRGRVDG